MSHHRRARGVSPIRAATLAITAVIAACGSPSPSPSASASVSPVIPAGPSAPSSSAPASGAATGSGAPATAGAAADPSLLSVVGADAAGVTLTFDPATTATEVADPTLDPNIAALATGIVAAGGASTDPTDLVIVNVVRLRDAGVDADWFRGWRDSYDDAACQRAGGVSGHAEANMAGHDVFIGSCSGGAFTYHTRLRDGSVVVSLTSIGPGRVGERLLDHLTP